MALSLGHVFWILFSGGVTPQRRGEKSRELLKVPEGGIEPATQGLGIKERLMAISHHFQTLIYQPVPGTILEYVGLCWVIFGSSGYKIVTF